MPAYSSNRNNPEIVNPETPARKWRDAREMRHSIALVLIAGVLGVVASCPLAFGAFMLEERSRPHLLTPLSFSIQSHVAATHAGWMMLAISVIFAFLFIMMLINHPKLDMWRYGGKIFQAFGYSLAISCFLSPPLNFVLNRLFPAITPRTMLSINQFELQVALFMSFAVPMYVVGLALEYGARKLKLAPRTQM